MAFAHALHSMWKEECGGEERLCEAMAHGGHLHGHHLLQHLREVSFTGMVGGAGSGAGHNTAVTTLIT